IFDGVARDPLHVKEDKDLRFDDQRNVVELTFPSLTPDIYRLEVAGPKIVDYFGNPLEQTEGGKGADFRKVLSQATALQRSGLPSESRGITGDPAPYVPYPEFTKPRRVPDGFNPSDHVETRVARLYYYRDAHRVAQIINRDARSYNRQAVEVRRRMADKARDDADRLTDERRALERAAVQAAKEARALEPQLADAQQQLAEARSRSQAAADNAERLRRIAQEAQIERPAAQAEQQRFLRDIEGDLENLRKQRAAEDNRRRSLESELELLRKQRAEQEDA